MSVMSKAPTPVALVISDLHLSLSKPACRADKQSWLDVQAAYLKQVKDTADHYCVSVVCCGDVFDKYNPAPELIRFAIEHLPRRMLCVPGQHDLPEHRSDQMHRSGFGVLLAAGSIKQLKPDWPEVENNTDFFGFGWDDKITNFHRHQLNSSLNRVAIIHRFCWISGKGYEGAPQECNLPAYRDALEGFNLAFFGDNHNPFIANVHPHLDLTKTCVVVNCGTLIRRKTNEIPYQPSMWLLWNNRKVQRIVLKTDADEFHENVKDDLPETPFDMQEFIRRLESLGDEALDFAATVRQHLRSEDIPIETKNVILKALTKK